MKIILLLCFVFTALQVNASTKVLFLVTEADQQILKKGKVRKTGFFLNEFYEPYKHLADNGYEIDIATPTGKAPSVDPESLKNKYWGDLTLKEEAISFVKNSKSIAKPLNLELNEVNVDDYSGVIIPGGQGVMMDVIYDRNVYELVDQFYKDEKVVGLMCHAPALLWKMVDEGYESFKGYKLTSVSIIEEKYIELIIMGGKAKDRMIRRKLVKRGFTSINTWPRGNFSVIDRNLVTNQNPYSSSSFNDNLDKAFNKTN